MSRLTSRMRDALREVKVGVVETFVWHRGRRAGTEGGMPDGPNPQSLRALERRGLVLAEANGQSTRDGHYVAWRLTDAGRAALDETES